MDTSSGTPQLIDERYQIESELGRGGMATVYRARDVRYDRPVALKVLLPELGAMLGRERFQREILLTARFQHPHILPVLDSGQSAEGLLWYAMPLADGESLRSRLEREGQLPIDEALRIATEVAAALSHAHAHGVVHRDIKPENILFSSGHALVADFGIARAFDGTATERLTQTGMSLGTPHYMSPEQSMGDSIDGRSDQYALGCVLYEMLAGEPPYDGPTAQSIIAKRLSLPAPLVRTLRDRVPESVEYALSVSLARLPADRFATVDTFLTALTGPVPAGFRTPVRRPASRRKRSLMAAAVIVAAVALGWRAVRASSLVPPSASVIAVMPFVPATADTALHRLGRDLAGTVSASLEGVGEIRTVDRLTILAQVREGSAAMPLAGAAALARRLGATSVVHGSLGREGERVRLDVGLYTTADLAPLGHGTVLAAPESLSALTDSVVWQLLGEIWRRGKPPTPTLAAVTTRSVPALRAYLDGERELVASRGDQARAAFGRAIAADSTFWFAYYRFGNSMGWVVEGDTDSAAEAVYWSHRHLLPERERLLIEASRSDSGQLRQREKLEAIVSRYPDYWPAWWILSDKLMHYYPYIGSSSEDARRALERTVALNPRMVMAWRHLAEVYLQEDDTVGLANALDSLDRLDADAIFSADEPGRDLLHWYRTALAVMRDRTVAEQVADSASSRLRGTANDPATPQMLLLFAGSPAAQTRLNRALVQRRQEGTPELGALGWAMRGAWDSALAVRDRYGAGRPDTLWVLDSYRLAVLGAWLGALSPSEAEHRRPEAIRLARDRSPGYTAELFWLGGLLAAARHDRTALAVARDSLRGTGARRAGELEQSLGAFLAAEAGDVSAAAEAMTALEWRMGDTAPFFFGRASPHSLLRGVDRLAASRWQAMAGDTTEALRLLTWHEAKSSLFDDKFPLAPHAYLLGAKLADARGDAPAALRGYRQFLVRYDQPPVAHLAYVAEARDAIVRLNHPR